VTLSSLNRHSVATLEDVGIPKTESLKKHLAAIFPYADIESMVTLYNPENAEAILEGSPDFVVDAIDNLDTKLHLLKTCVSKGIKVISSMGAGAKADPSRIQIADISQTFGS
jgi:tRNA A37 threonylcarbamoyladenosine dehydratase